jgi:hypothetical protein
MDDRGDENERDGDGIDGGLPVSGKRRPAQSTAKTMTVP